MAKLRTATAEETLVMNTFRTCVEKYAAMANYVRSVNFNEQTNKSSLLDCGSFKQRIVYYPDYFLEANFIDVEFSFGDSAYSYTFYDVFNLFDIDDFDLYYYKDCSIAVDIDNAVKTIFNATEKHRYYLEKAGDDYNLPQLIKNYETDMDTVYHSADWREEEMDFDEVPMNHPLMSFADGEINDKMLKLLRKKNAKGKLDTIYEKRLLKHLEQGRNVERKAVMQKDEYEKVYSKKMLLIMGVTFICSFAVALALSFAVHAVIYKGAEMFSTTHSLFGVIQTGLPVGTVILSALTSLVLSAFVNLFFGKKLVIKAVPEKMKTFAESHYKKQSESELGILAKPAKILAAILLPLLAVFLFSLTLIDVGFYDNHVRYSDVLFSVYDVSYEDLEIYRVAGYYDDEEFVENENAYALSDGSDNYYDCGELRKGGKAEQKLLEIAEKYDKTIIEVKSIEEIIDAETE